MYHIKENMFMSIYHWGDTTKIPFSWGYLRRRINNDCKDELLNIQHNQTEQLKCAKTTKYTDKITL